MTFSYTGVIGLGANSPFKVAENLEKYKPLFLLLLPLTPSYFFWI